MMGIAGRNFRVLSVLVVVMMGLALYLYVVYDQTKNSILDVIKEEIFREKIALVKNFADQMSQRIVLFESNVTQQALYEEISNDLKLIKDNNIKYLYIIYKDKEGVLRYFADSTLQKDQQAEYQQRFFPTLDIWEKVYAKRRFELAYQDKIDSLWITLAYPVIYKDQVIAVIGADFSYDTYKEILQVLSPMEKVFFYIACFALVMFLLLYIMIYFYYTTRKKALIDPLTQIYNRNYLQEFLLHHTLQDYFLVMIDLDNFKQINDNYGHDVGDVVLQSVVKKIASQIRQKDIFLRFGGEEFVLLLHKNDIHKPENIANRIRRSVQEMDIHAYDRVLHVTISMGINPFPFGAKNVEEAIKIADEQLYKAKIAGRNKVKVYKEGDGYKSETFSRISDIQSAIDDNRVKCAFQGIFEPESKTVKKYEMLLRIIDTNGDILAPNSFLPYIRHTQVYIKLTNFVLQRALYILKQERDIELSINLDIQDLVNEDIIKLLQESFSAKKHYANKVTIEILEHEHVKDFVTIEENIKTLKAIGFRIAIDDFGSGYANFDYLIHLDIDVLKIDGSIIKQITTSQKALTMTHTIIKFAHAMGMEVVAEFVETQQTCEILSELGVDYLQGYYLARPEIDAI